jgi:hypothetical protein
VMAQVISPVVSVWDSRNVDGLWTLSFQNYLAVILLLKRSGAESRFDSVGNVSPWHYSKPECCQIKVGYTVAQAAVISTPSSLYSTPSCMF